MKSVSAVQKLYLDGKQRWPRVKLCFEAFETHCRRVCAPDTGTRYRARSVGSVSVFCMHRVRYRGAADHRERRPGRGTGGHLAHQSRGRISCRRSCKRCGTSCSSGQTPKSDSTRGAARCWVGSASQLPASHSTTAAARVSARLREVELTEQLAAHSANPETFLTKARLGPAFQEAIRRAVDALAAQDRNVLRMHVSGGCSIDEIGRAYNVHRATAARWIDRSRTRIYDAVRCELCTQDSKLTESEFKSLANLLRSQLELQLSSQSRLGRRPTRSCLTRSSNRPRPA